MEENEAAGSVYSSTASAARASGAATAPVEPGERRRNQRKRRLRAVRPGAGSASGVASSRIHRCLFTVAQLAAGVEALAEAAAEPGRPGAEERRQVVRDRFAARSGTSGARRTAVQPPGFWRTYHWKALGFALCLFATSRNSGAVPRLGRNPVDF